MSEHRHHHSQSTTRDIVSLVFSFFLSVTLLVEAVLLVAHIGVFLEGSLLSVLDDQYYEYVLKYVNEQSYYYTIPTGIDPSVTEEVFDIADVHYDVDQYVQATLRGTEFEADTSAAEERLLEHVNNFFVDSGVKLSDETDDIANSYVKEIMDIYRGIAKMPGLNTISNFRTRYMKYSLMGSVAVALFALVLVSVVVRLHHHIHRSLRYLAYATGGAALMSFIVPFVLYQSKWYLGLNLTPQYFYHFGTSLVARILKLCMMAGGVYLLLTLALIMASAAARQRFVRRQHGQHGR